jgi:hypothetical protein
MSEARAKPQKRKEIINSEARKPGRNLCGFSFMASWLLN